MCLRVIYVSYALSIIFKLRVALKATKLSLTQNTQIECTKKRERDGKGKCLHAIWTSAGESFPFLGV